MSNVLECEVKGCKSCSAWTELTHPKGRLQVAKHFMEICPSLSHVALQTKRRPSSWMSFRRTGDNVVTLAGSGILNDSSWREKSLRWGSG